MFGEVYREHVAQEDVIGRFGGAGLAGGGDDASPPLNAGLPDEAVGEHVYVSDEALHLPSSDL